MNIGQEFFRDKRVLVTGHTGFKGSWLCKILYDMEAKVTGYAMEPVCNSLYKLLGLEHKIHSIIGDIRNFSQLKQTFIQEKPEIVIHLAAQPIVRESYITPQETYEINVLGTVNLLECIRQTDSVISVVNVTTDKVYDNQEWEWGYREDDRLDGFDPYSNSKSCSELVTHSYNRSFLKEKGIAVSTMRAGNVIGGGDFSKDRIIPDCVRAMQNKEKIIVRNPYSVRPYQHVLEPLHAYLLVAWQQAVNPRYAGCYNVGPEEKDCVTTGELVQLFCEMWGPEASWESQPMSGPHEAFFLKLDCSRMKSRLQWKPVWDIEKAVEKTVEWAKTYMYKESVSECMDRQLHEFWSESSIWNG